jgi:hypothetical protein
MNRKTLKLVLFVAGCSLAVTGMAFFFLLFIHLFQSMGSDTGFNLIREELPMAAFMVPSAYILSLVSFMHSRDLKSNKPNISVLFRILSIVGLAWAVPCTVGLILMIINF